MLDKIRERERRRDRQANRRTGLIAAEMHNIWNREKGDPRVKPMDFWQEPGEPKRMTPEEARQHFTAWAEGRNQTVH